MRMNSRGIFMWYQGYRETRRARNSGQIAVMITLIIAVLFVLIVVLMNIGQIAQVKSLVQVASDGAALSLASNLGSYSHYLSMEFFNGEESECSFNWGFFFQLLFIAVLLIVSLGSAAPGVAAWTAAALSVGEIVGLALAVGGLILQVAVLDPGAMQSINEAFQKMGQNAQLMEGAIQYGLTNCVTDTRKEEDLDDMDQDGRIDDKIGTFTVWYLNRVLDLVGDYSKQDSVADFIDNVNCTRGLCLFDEGYNELLDIEDYPWPNPIPDGYYENLNVDCGDMVFYLGEDTAVPDSSTGIYELFYDLRELEMDPEIELETNLEDFWEPGRVPCEGDDCEGEPPPENDITDDLYFAIDDFHWWANGGPDPTDPEVMLPGILDFNHIALTSTFDTWFPQLYQEVPADPISDYYHIIEHPEYSWDITLDEFEAHLITLRDEYILGKVGEYESEIGEILGEIGDLETYIADFLSDIADFEDEIDDLWQDYDDAGCNLPDPPNPEICADILGWIAELEAQIDILYGQIADLTEQIAGLNEQIAEIQAKIDLLYNYVRRVSDVINVCNAFEGGIGPFLADVLNFANDPETAGDDWVNDATYSWQDGRNNWHHVRVEVPTVDAPTVESYKKSWGFQNCSKMVRQRGNVWIRITRYDQDKDPMAFASGVSLWKFRFRSNPEVEDELDPHPEDPDWALAPERAITVISRAHFGPQENEIYLYRPSP